MELIDAILQRRSVRKYEPTPIPDEVLEELVTAGLYAPSAVNRQPWFFVVIRSKEQMDKLIEAMDYVSRSIEPNLKRRFERHPEVVKDTTAFVRRLGGAPVCILAFRLKPDDVDDALSTTQSVAAAIENILLAATDKGLGSCWLTAPVEARVGEQIRETFAPDKGALVAMITLGYPAQMPKLPPRRDGRYVMI